MDLRKNLKVKNAKAIIDCCAKMLSGYKGGAELVGVSKGTVSKWKHPDKLYLPRFEFMYPLLKLMHERGLETIIEFEVLEGMTDEQISEIEHKEVINELRAEIEIESTLLAEIWFGPKN